MLPRTEMKKVNLDSIKIFVLKNSPSIHGFILSEDLLRFEMTILPIQNYEPDSINLREEYPTSQILILHFEEIKEIKEIY